MWLLKEIHCIKTLKSTLLSGELRGSKGFKLQHVDHRTRDWSERPHTHPPPKKRNPSKSTFRSKSPAVFTPKTNNCHWPPTEPKGFNGMLTNARDALAHTNPHQYWEWTEIQLPGLDNLCKVFPKTRIHTCCAIKQQGTSSTHTVELRVKIPRSLSTGYGPSFHRLVWVREDLSRSTGFKLVI